jgi:hypothetical protein
MEPAKDRTRNNVSEPLDRGRVTAEICSAATQFGNQGARFVGEPTRTFDAISEVKKARALCPGFLLKRRCHRFRYRGTATNTPRRDFLDVGPSALGAVARKIYARPLPARTTLRCAVLMSFGPSCASAHFCKSSIEYVARPFQTRYGGPEPWTAFFAKVVAAIGSPFSVRNRAASARERWVMISPKAQD